MLGFTLLHFHLFRRIITSDWTHELRGSASVITVRASFAALTVIMQLSNYETVCTNMAAVRMREYHWCRDV